MARCGVWWRRRKRAKTCNLKDEYRSDEERKSSICTKSPVLLHPASWETSSMYVQIHTYLLGTLRATDHCATMDYFVRIVAPSSLLGERSHCIEGAYWGIKRQQPIEFSWQKILRVIDSVRPPPKKSSPHEPQTPPILSRCGPTCSLRTARLLALSP